MLSLLELHALKGDAGICQQFDAAKTAWVESFTSLSKLYRQAPEKNDNMTWIDDAQKQMDESLKEAHCELGSEALRLAALEAALDGLPGNYTSDPNASLNVTQV